MDFDGASFDWGLYFTIYNPYTMLPSYIGMMQGDKFIPYMAECAPNAKPVELINLPIPIDFLQTIKYEDKDVEEGRVNYNAIIGEFKEENRARYLLGPDSETLFQDQVYPFFNPGSILLFPDIMVNYPKLIYPELYETWHTRYEEIKCIGLDKRANQMTAIIQVKRAYGYKGNKCTNGSKEYVSFWIDWDCDGFDPNDHIGFNYVTVHDLEESFPPEGVYFAVSVNFTNKQPRPCDEINVYPVRAILSWEECPGPIPTFSYHWGNVIDRCIQLEPLAPDEEECPAGSLCPHIVTIGGVTPTQIDPNTGYANGPAVFDGWTAIDSPFGGLVTITGEILNVPDFSYDDCNVIHFSPDVRYKFEYNRFDYADGNWTQWDDMTAINQDRFLIQVDKTCTICSPPIYDIDINKQFKSKWNIRDSEGFYSYYDDDVGYIQQTVAGSVLMKWSTSGLIDGLYQIRMVIKNGPIQLNFSPRKIILDNTPPTVDLDFTLGICFQVPVGTKITGKYTAFDQHLLESVLYWDCGAGCKTLHGLNKNWDYIGLEHWKYVIAGSNQIETLRDSVTLGPINIPEEFQRRPTNKALGRYDDTFYLDTNKFAACGYFIRVRANERTIVNNHFGWRHRAIHKNFCLTKPFPIPTGPYGLGMYGGLYGFGTYGGLYGFGTYGGLYGFGIYGGLYGFGTYGGLYGFGMYGVNYNPYQSLTYAYNPFLNYVGMSTSVFPYTFNFGYNSSGPYSSSGSLRTVRSSAFSGIYPYQFNYSTMLSPYWNYR